MSRILHHVDRKDFKKTRQKQIGEQKKCDAQKLKEWQEAEATRPYKSNWREEINLQESDWTPVAGSIANATAQTFSYSIPNFQTDQPNTVTVSGLGGVESVPSTVTVDFGFGETENVPGPNYSQLGLQGYAPPLGNVNRRRDFEDVNPRLDASQEFARNVNSDVFMNARVDQYIQSGQNKLDTFNKASEDINNKYQKLNSELYDEYFDKSGIKKRADGMSRSLLQMPDNLRQELDDKLSKLEDARQREFDALMDWNNSPTPDEEPKVDPYDDRIVELNMALDKMKKEGTLISRYKTVSPGERGYVDTTNMANAIGYNRKPIYTAPAQEMFSELEKLYALQLAWLDKKNPGGKVPGADKAAAEYNRTMGSNSEPPEALPPNPNEPVPTPDNDVLDQLANLPGLASAKNFIDHYIDNFVQGDGKQDQNLTNLLSRSDQNWLKNALGKDSGINNPKINRLSAPNSLYRIMQNAPRGIRNSIGNGATLDVDYFNRTGDYKIDKSYVFTQPEDLEYRGLPSNLLTKPLIDAPKNYAAVKMGGDISPLIQNPMRFHVVIKGPKRKKKVNESTWSKLKKYR